MEIIKFGKSGAVHSTTTEYENNRRLEELLFAMTFCTPRPTDEDIEEYRMLKGGLINE